MVSRERFSLTPNGPAIKVVSVAERVKAGAEKLSRGRVLVPAGMSEAWRGFCRPVAGFLSFTSVAVQGRSEPRIYPRLQS